MAEKKKEEEKTTYAAKKIMPRPGAAKILKPKKKPIVEEI